MVPDTRPWHVKTLASRRAYCELAPRSLSAPQAHHHAAPGILPARARGRPRQWPVACGRGACDQGRRGAARGPQAARGRDRWWTVGCLRCRNARQGRRGGRADRAQDGQLQGEAPGSIRGLDLARRSGARACSAAAPQRPQYVAAPRSAPRRRSAPPPPEWRVGQSWSLRPDGWRGASNRVAPRPWQLAWRAGRARYPTPTPHTWHTGRAPPHSLGAQRHATPATNSPTWRRRRGAAPAAAPPTPATPSAARPGTNRRRAQPAPPPTTLPPSPAAAPSPSAWWRSSTCPSPSSTAR